MSKPQLIEDYGLIGNLRTAALVGRNGSIDWLPLPRFDSPACFSALLGDHRNGRWLVAPQETPRHIWRRYLDGSLILETTFETGSGRVQVTDFMPFTADEGEDVVRIVRGLRGTVPVAMELCLRFDYGRIVPWVTCRGGEAIAIAGPDAVRVRAPVDLDLGAEGIECRFDLHQGETIALAMTWFPSFADRPPTPAAEALLHDTASGWQDWSAQCQVPAQWREASRRSAITLKALTHQDTGGVVAAATTSLPERLGGARNWDYRYCWIRDATFTLYALTRSGFPEEARAWREWLRRAVAGEPPKLQIMYGIGGERRLDEQNLPWLTGYAGSTPVRIGNQAYRQRQLDIFGEVMDAFHTFRTHHLREDEDSWQIEHDLIPFLERHWRDPGAGIWERRDEPRPYVTSRVMSWVAVDRAIKGVERFGFQGPAERWKRLRREIHEDVCRYGYSESRGAFVEVPGENELDASALLIPLVGFLPPDDPRVVSTMETVRRELGHDGFIRRYDTDASDDGLPKGEATFTACTLWMVDNLSLMGRDREARELFEQVLDVRNDLGLLAEQYDPVNRRQLGNFPQAFSHVGILNSAHNLAGREGPAHHRARK